mgnify:CR=1 FL=1
MFGWEFPPHILGGLGTASYGLTKGLSLQPDMDITFCIPKPWGDEDQSFMRIIGMNSVPIVWRDVDWNYVNSRVGSYMDPQLYYDLRDHIYADFSYMYVNDLGCMEFSGRYPDNLHEEINNYSIVAGSPAAAVRHHSCTRLVDLSGGYPCQASQREAIGDSCACHGLRPESWKCESHGLQYRKERYGPRGLYHVRERADAPDGD